jgi:hypothetical protein
MTVARVAMGLIILLLTPIIFFITKYTADVLTDATAGGFNTTEWPAVVSFGFMIFPAGILLYCLFWAFSKLHPSYTPGEHRWIGERAESKLESFRPLTWATLDPFGEKKKKKKEPPKWTRGMTGIPYKKDKE